MALSSSDVIYNGKRINKSGFRTFIYGYDGEKKIVNNWNEYEKHMETGLWFSCKDDVPKKEEEKISTQDLIEKVKKKIKHKSHDNS